MCFYTPQNAAGLSLCLTTMRHVQPCVSSSAVTIVGGEGKHIPGPSCSTVHYCKYLISKSRGWNLGVFRHIDMVKTTRCSNWASKWEKKGDLCDLVPEQLVWVCSETVDLLGSSFLAFTEWSGGEKNPVSTRSVLLPEVRGWWSDWSEMTERLR